MPRRPRTNRGYPILHYCINHAGGCIGAHSRGSDVGPLVAQAHYVGDNIAAMLAPDLQGRETSQIRGQAARHTPAV